MLFQPLADAGYRTFVGVRRGMRPMKDPNFVEQHHRNTTTFTFGDFSAKLGKQSFYISPLNVSAGRTREDQFKGALVLPLHAAMVLQQSTGVSGVCSDG
jgi:hypothetical protein